MFLLADRESRCCQPGVDPARTARASSFLLDFAASRYHQELGSLFCPLQHMKLLVKIHKQHQQHADFVHWMCRTSLATMHLRISSLLPADLLRTLLSLAGHACFNHAIIQSNASAFHVRKDWAQSCIVLVVPHLSASLGATCLCRKAAVIIWHLPALGGWW